VVVLEEYTSISGASQAVELTTLFSTILKHLMADRRGELKDPRARVDLLPLFGRL
jgi:hypothetical protein